MTTIDPTHCAYCHVQLPGNVRYFCMPHWDRLPAKERKMVSHMVAHDQELTSKLEKCVKLLSAAQP